MNTPEWFDADFQHTLAVTLYLLDEAIENMEWLGEMSTTELRKEFRGELAPAMLSYGKLFRERLEAITGQTLDGEWIAMTLAMRINRKH